MTTCGHVWKSSGLLTECVHVVGFRTFGRTGWVVPVTDTLGIPSDFCSSGTNGDGDNDGHGCIRQVPDFLLG